MFQLHLSIASKINNQFLVPQILDRFESKESLRGFQKLALIKEVRLVKMPARIGQPIGLGPSSTNRCVAQKTRQKDCSSTLAGPLMGVEPKVPDRVVGPL